MMKGWKDKVNPIFRFAKPAIPILLGISLIVIGQRWEKERDRTYADGVLLYNQAFSELAQGKAEEAYQHFAESYSYAQDPNLKAEAFYNAATLAWSEGLADYPTLVELYKESLRNNPNFPESSFNLELLYFLKEEGKLELPQDPEEGEGEGHGVPANAI